MKKLGEGLRVKLLRPHVDGCASVRSRPDNPWWIPGKALYRDALGRANNGGTWRWQVIECNSCDCDGMAIVLDDGITRLVQRALEEEKR